MTNTNPKTTTSLNKQDVLDLISQGKTIREIAESFNLGFEKVRWFLRSNDIKMGTKRARKLTDEQERKAYLYYKKHGIKAVCKKFDVSRDVIYRIVAGFKEIATKHITDEYLIELRKHAFMFARRKNMPHVADDFASWSVIKAIEGGRMQAIKYLWLNYLDTLGPVTVLATEEPEDGLHTVQLVSEDDHDGNSIKGDDIIDRICRRYNMSKDERIVIMLRYKHDFLVEDIAKVLGLTTPRISQIITAVLSEVHHDWLKKKLKNDEECLEDLRNLDLKERVHHEGI